MRKARRVDGNHGQIRDLLRSLGCLVEDTSDVGRGFPDLVIRTPGGRMLMVEIKDGTRRPSERRLTEHEQRFAARWGADYVVVESEAEAIALAQSKGGDDK